MFVLGLLAVGAYLHKSSALQSGDLDLATLYEVIESIGRTGRPWTYNQATWWYFRKIDVTGTRAEEFCSGIEKFTAPVNLRPLNFFVSTHANVILYLLAPFAYLIGAPIVVTALTILSYVGIVALIYVFLRRMGTSTPASISFSLLVMAHPFWSESLQYTAYVDKWFPFSLLLFAVSLGWGRTIPILAGSLCVLIGERGAVYLGAFMIAYALLMMEGKPLVRRLQLAGLGAGSIILGLLLVALVTANPDNASFLTSSFGNYTRPEFQARLLNFAAYNGPFLFVALIGDWRAALIAFGAMIPNIHGDIGGAEKLGWATHYHSYYFPVLIWAAASGFSRIEAWVRAKKPGRFEGILLPLGAALLALLYFAADPYTPPSHSALSWQRLSESIFPRIAYSVLHHGTITRSRGHFLAEMEAAIPPGTKVSTTALFMPLYRNRQLDIFPLNLDGADFVVVGAGEKDGRVHYSGLTSYISQDNQKAMMECALIRMRQLGFTEIYRNLGYGTAVFGRRDSPANARSSVVLLAAAEPGFGCFATP